MPRDPAFRRRSGGGLLRAAALPAATAGLLLAPAVSRADAPSACATAQISSISQPACWRPFTTGSPFNAELPASPPLAPDSAAVQQHMATYGWSLDGSKVGFTLHGGGSRPVYFATPSDPVMTVHCTDEDGPGTCQGSNGVDVNGAQINVPAGAEPHANTDAHMTVVETATGTEYDFWHTSISGSVLTAGAGGEVSVNTSDGTGGAGDAADFALSAGLLRPSELASGQIDHALVITVPCTNATGAHVGYTYPARGGWGEYCGQYWSEDAATAPMLGQRFQLAMTDAQIAASGAPAWEQTIMTALAHYGAYIEDTNGSWRYEGMDILTQDSASWTDVGQADQWASVVGALGGSNSTLTSSVPIPTSDLRLVDTCVTQGTCPGMSGPPVSPPPLPASPAGPATSATSPSTPATSTTSPAAAQTSAPGTPAASPTRGTSRSSSRHSRPRHVGKRSRARSERLARRRHGHRRATSLRAPRRRERLPASRRRSRPPRAVRPGP